MMNRLKNTMIKLAFLTLVFTVFLSLALPALAADGAPGEPWDDVIVTFGAVTLAWTSVQMGIVRILRGITIGDRPLLATDGMVWLANGIIGVIGLTLAATQSGQPILAGIIQALLAIFAASGQHEFLSKTGKKSSRGSLEDPSDPDTTDTLTQDGSTARART